MSERLERFGCPVHAASVYEQAFTVSFRYPVYFTDDAFEPRNTTVLDALCRGDGTRRQRFACFVDAGVARAWPALTARIATYAARHGERLQLAAPPEVVVGGEAAKNDPAVVRAIQRRLSELGIDRQSSVVAVGGGAVLDAVGYAAASVHRGVRMVRLPTTVLAQNDSGVGVKTGINAFGIKNFLGSFAPPSAVVNDARFLATLAGRDRIAGMAEAVKVALIRDGLYFAWLEANAEALAAFEPAAVGPMVRRCAELHMRQIAHGGDPFESGSARPLDYGHWSAHRLESMSAYALRHGEAVAIGVALDARYSVQLGLLAEGEEARVCALLECLGFRLWHPALEAVAADGAAELLRGLEEFREHLGGELTITLLAGIGRGVEVHSMDAAGIRRAVDWLKQRDAARCGSTT